MAALLSGGPQAALDRPPDRLSGSAVPSAPAASPGSASPSNATPPARMPAPVRWQNRPPPPPPPPYPRPEAGQAGGERPAVGRCWEPAPLACWGGAQHGWQQPAACGLQPRLGWEAAAERLASLQPRAAAAAARMPAGVGTWAGCEAAELADWSPEAAEGLVIHLTGEPADSEASLEATQEAAAPFAQPPALALAAVSEEEGGEDEGDGGGACGQRVVFWAARGDGPTRKRQRRGGRQQQQAVAEGAAWGWDSEEEAAWQQHLWEQREYEARQQRRLQQRPPPPQRPAAAACEPAAQAEEGEEDEEEEYWMDEAWQLEQQRLWELQQQLLRQQAAAWRGGGVEEDEEEESASPSWRVVELVPAGCEQAWDRGEHRKRRWDGRGHQPRSRPHGYDDGQHSWRRREHEPRRWHGARRRQPRQEQHGWQRGQPRSPSPPGYGRTCLPPRAPGSRSRSRWRSPSPPAYGRGRPARHAPASRSCSRGKASALRQQGCGLERSTPPPSAGRAPAAGGGGGSAAGPAGAEVGGGSAPLELVTYAPIVEGEPWRMVEVSWRQQGPGACSLRGQASTRLQAGGRSAARLLHAAPHPPPRLPSAAQVGRSLYASGLPVRETRVVLRQALALALRWG